jgi:phosphoglycolate phosphatase
MKNSSEVVRGMKHVIFDLDGTLVDSIPGIGSSLKLAFESIGRSFPDKNLRRSIGPPIRIIALRLDSSLSPVEVSEVERAYRSNYDSVGWSKTLLFDYAESTLRRLSSSGLQLFLVTNKPLIPTLKILRHFGLSDLFTEVLTPNSREPRYSSKSEMLADLIRRRTLIASYCCLVGDTREDKEAALANNVRFICAEYGYGTRTKWSCSISALSDLLRILEISLENP